MSLTSHRPGETPIEDASELKVPGILLRSELNRAEFANITKASARYLGLVAQPDDPPFDFAFYLRLHREMFEDVWGWAGRLRTTITTVGLEPHLIEQQLYELSLNLPYWKNEPLLMQAARLHHRAVQIHPFENGTGRWSRLLANIWLHRHQHDLTRWPKEVGLESSVSGEYIQALKEADRHNHVPLFELHQRFTIPEPADEDE